MPKILLVEDNEMNRDMLSRRLVRSGFDVVIAVDGGQGVAMASTEKPDLILMDMSLPVLDGWEATRRVKSDPATRDVRVVVVTAEGEEIRDHIIGLGADEYFTKPFSPTALLRTVETVLAGPAESMPPGS